MHTPNNIPTINQAALTKDLNNSNLSAHAAKLLKFGMTPRQIRLNAIWSVFRGTQYDLRTHDWNGALRNVDMNGSDVVIRELYIPDGFVAVTADPSTPLKSRRPPSPYRLPTAIVNKFTSMLFGEGVIPKYVVEGNPELEDWLQGCVTASKLWQKMRSARKFGGGCGTSVIMAAFVRGKPAVEVFDPRFCVPTWLNQRERLLASMEFRYMYPKETWDPKKNEYVNIWYWYRRSIDDKTDIVYKPSRVDVENPVWEIDTETKHPFGRCPILWAHNVDVDDAEDGDADFWPAIESFNELDTLNAQGRKGIISNCDPTTVVKTKRDTTSGIKKGSDNAIVLDPGDEASYMEITGSGPIAALAEAKEIRREILEVCQCVLDQPDSSVARTATEIQRVYAGMISRVDDMRGTYGDGMLIPLAGLWITGAQSIANTAPTEVNGKVVKPVLIMPVKKTTDTEGNVTVVKLKLPENAESEEVTISWPPYFRATPTDLVAMVQAAVEAVGTLLDDSAAIRWIAPAFGIDDADALIQRIRAQQVEARKIETEDATKLAAAKQAAKPVKKVK